MRHPRAWSDEEQQHLEHLAGNVPGPALSYVYNLWAKRRGYLQRTQSAVKSRLSDMHVSRALVGDWLDVGYLTEMLCVSDTTVHRWIRRGYISAWVIRSASIPYRYIRRSELVKFARERPHHFGGIEESRLVMVLEDESLAQQIRREYPCRPYGRRRVRCVETGRVYDSITAAASAVYVNPRAIQQAIQRGWRAAGYHWTDVSHATINAHDHCRLRSQARTSSRR